MSQVDKRVKNRLFTEMKQKPFLKSQKVYILCLSLRCIWDGDKLFEKNDDEFNHLFMLFISLLFLKAVCKVLHQGLGNVTPND